METRAKKAAGPGCGAYSIGENRMTNLQLGRMLAEDDRRRAKPNPTEDELVSLEDLPPPPPKPDAAPAKKRKRAPALVAVFP